MEDKLYNSHRVFGMNTLKRGARVRRTDSLSGFTGQSDPTLTHTTFEGKKITPPSSRGVGTARQHWPPG